jgi:heme/copper-type cytochrome/quinol oxidase subunit 2
MHPAWFIATTVAAGLIGLNIWFVYALHQPPAPPDTKPLVDYKDFVSILLTAVTAVVAVLAFGVAILAIWGYTTMMRVAELTAAAEAKAVAERQMSDHVMKEQIEDAAKRVLAPVLAALAQTRTEPSERESKREVDDGISIPDLPS